MTLLRCVYLASRDKSAEQGCSASIAVTGSGPSRVRVIGSLSVSGGARVGVVGGPALRSRPGVRVVRTLFGGSGASVRVVACRRAAARSGVGIVTACRRDLSAVLPRRSARSAQPPGPRAFSVSYSWKFLSDKPARARRRAYATRRLAFGLLTSSLPACGCSPGCAG